MLVQLAWLMQPCASTRNAHAPMTAFDASFAGALLSALVRGFRFAVPHNVDPFRYPGRKRMSRVGVRTALRTLTTLLRSSASGAASASALSDPASARLLLELSAFRVLGGRHYRLPTNQPRFWEHVHSVEHNLVVERGVSRAGGYDLDLYRLEGVSGPLHVEAHPMNILNTFLMEEYRFDRGGVAIATQPGDVVVDAGGCWGDTALYFADRVGRGKVFVFEFEEENLQVLRRNLARNPHLADRIEVVERAVWSNSNETLRYAVAGPATRLGASASPGSEMHEARTISIDDWRRDAAVARVNFIKMDIEGAEVPALEGATRTIQSDVPRLAISTYHSLRDLLVIPSMLEALSDSYDVHLGHATIHAEETIAFATPRKSAPAPVRRDAWSGSPPTRP